MINLGLRIRSFYNSFVNPSEFQKREQAYFEAAQITKQQAELKEVINSSGLSKQQVKDGLDLSKPVSDVIANLVDSSSLF